MAERARRMGDGAMSEFIGTILLVGAVVVLGGALAVVMTATLQAAPPPVSHVALSSLEPGDTQVALVYRGGEIVRLDALSLTVSRNGSASVDVPRAMWSAPSSPTWSPGETLTFALSPAAGQDERIVVRVVQTATNGVMAELAARTPYFGSTASPLGTPTLFATASPGNIVADASSASRLTVRVSHPAGVLSIASVTADLRNLTNFSASAASLLSLNDAGGEGDALGGDGVWSALLRAPVNTSVGTRNITINATDITGRTVASTTVAINITASLGSIATAIGDFVQIAPNATGNFTGTQLNGTGNFTGNCYGCLIMGGVVAFEGTRLTAPTSANLTRFMVANFTWDRGDPGRLVGDAAVVRVVGNGYTWSAYLQFDYVSNTPVLKQAVFWDANRSSAYLPNSTVPLEGLRFNMSNPMGAGMRCTTNTNELVGVTNSWRPTLTCGAQQALYRNSNIQGEPVFFIAWLREESASAFRPSDVGIISVDAEIN